MKLQESADAVIVQPDGPVRASVIWLHGLGADGHDFVPIVRELGLAADAGIRFIFPHATVRPVTLNGGMPMRAWYDIVSLDRKGKMDDKGILDSVARVRGLIEAERKAGVEPGRIVIAGFSQGGAIAMHAALRYPDRLAGLLALSTYLPSAESLARDANAANRDIPILMVHGQYDPVLNLEIGEWSRDQLKAMGQTVEWLTYPMAHEVCMEEIERIGAWLKDVLAD
ncbi:phospholipase/carboxylesterase [Panacagrimonas perspica]|uniref:Phospholipase/carboxylesterase n=1 Tax=Panacagrimonas perspica TaxID=381431 RepID=A0A4S3K7M2_9GAMM|nr:alpha/beta fold hydrolase [Panacagrimonas perspica]TDU26727.1 phospholipase/carboxylesterase [Panacagrimonas perspica]THD04068.1 carboxylesterase [Panacagrimonas perspica]